MFIDLDEIIIPSNSTSLSVYLDDIDESDIASFSFRSTYVPDNFPLTRLANSLAPELNTGSEFPFLRVIHEQRVLESGVGSKVVVKFQNALMMAIHSLQKASNLSYVNFKVPKEEALLFHYRRAPRNLVVKDAGRKSHRLEQLLKPLVQAVKGVQLELRNKTFEEINFSK